VPRLLHCHRSRSLRLLQPLPRSLHGQGKERIYNRTKFSFFDTKRAFDFLPGRGDGGLQSTAWGRFQASITHASSRPETSVIKGEKIVGCTSDKSFQDVHAHERSEAAPL